MSANEYAGKVSVIVAAHEKRDLFAATLESAEQQSYLDLEVLCVGSEQNLSAARVEDFKQYQRVKFISAVQKAGLAEQINTALARAQGAYVCIVRQGERLPFDFIQSLLQALKEQQVMLAVCHNTELTAVYADHPQGPQQYTAYPLAFNSPGRLDVSSLEQAKLLRAPHIAHCALFCQDGALKDLRFYSSCPELLDCELLLRAGAFTVTQSTTGFTAREQQNAYFPASILALHQLLTHLKLYDKFKRSHTYILVGQGLAWLKNSSGLELLFAKVAKILQLTAPQIPDLGLLHEWKAYMKYILTNDKHQSLKQARARSGSRSKLAARLMMLL